MRPSRTRLLQVLAIGALCAASGVNLLPQGRDSSSGDREQPRLLVWPGPPAHAAIRFLKSVPDPDGSTGRRRPFFQRLGRAFFSKSDEGMVRPLGLVAKNGILYVADPGGHALLVFDVQQNSLQRITKAGSELLVSPVDVALGNDRVFLSDSSLKRILVYDRKGRFLKIFAERDLERPTGLAFDEKSGKLYVTDTAKHQVRIYGPDGKLEKTFGRRGTREGEFNYPTHLSLGADGVLFVVDSLNYRVQTFRPDGVFVAEFGHHGDGSGDFASPKGLATDSRGHVYVVDALFDAVQVFDRHGQLLLSFGERGTAPGQFWLPAGVFIDEKDRIYVADSYNQRVQIFEFMGEPTLGD